jgi:hypothetical protein
MGNREYISQYDGNIQNSVEGIVSAILQEYEFRKNRDEYQDDDFLEYLGSWRILDND